MFLRLTGLLRKKPWKRGFFYPCCFTGDSSGSPRDGPDGGYMEPLGAVARLASKAVPATSRSADGNLTRAVLARPPNAVAPRSRLDDGHRFMVRNGEALASWIE
jgi:hypothetical protein